MITRGARLVISDLEVNLLDLSVPHSSGLSRVPLGLHYYAANTHTAIDRSNSLTEAPLPVAFHGKIATMAENGNLEMSKRREGVRNVPCPRNHPGLVSLPSSCIMEWKKIMTGYGVRNSSERRGKPR